MTDTTAKIREALEKAKYAMACPIGERAQWLCMHATLDVNKALALLDAERPSECHWSGDEYTGNWYGDCGIEFCFIDGTPTENEMAYCPKCGGKLIDDGYPKQEDDEDEEE